MTTTRAARLNRFASLAVLPVMLLAVLALSRQAQREPEAPLPDSGLIVVANLRDHTLTFHDLDTGQSSTLALPGPPHEMAELNGRLYITLGRADLLAEVDPRAPGTLRLLSLPGEPHGIAASPAGVLYVTLDKADALVAIDAASLTEIDRWPTAATPHAVALAEGVPYVAAARADLVQAIRPSGTRGAPVGSFPESIAVLPGLVATGDYRSGTVSLLSLPELAPRASVAVGGGPVRLLPLRESGLAVALQVAGSVAIVDTASTRVDRTVPVAARPDGLCLAPGGTHLAVASNAEDSLTVLDTATWRASATLPAGRGPGACLWLPR
ncbi:hypothetical protein [Tepidiforma sp.]|uniref:hypothetical protein n=1 Tax=Tepidiforma sp. TaxID=2682230 RepID=UPI002ADE2A1F|nr:hypothetical protein [Tepidiforma sp.]